MGETLSEQPAVEAHQAQQEQQEQQAQAVATAEVVIPDVNVNSAETLAHEEHEESEQIITHQHADGAVRQAESVEAVGKACPAMAGMSHRQVMLAMKMAVRGRERQAKKLAEKTATDANPDKDNALKRQQEARVVTKKAAIDPEAQKHRLDPDRIKRHELVAAFAEQLLRRNEDSTKIEEIAVSDKQVGMIGPARRKSEIVVDIKPLRANKTTTPTAPEIKEIKPAIKYVSPKRSTSKLVLKPKKTVVLKQAPKAKAPAPTQKAHLAEATSTQPAAEESKPAVLITKEQKKPLEKPLVLSKTERYTPPKTEIITRKPQVTETERVVPLSDIRAEVDMTIHGYTDARNVEELEVFTLDSRGEDFKVEHEIESQVQLQLIELEPAVVEAQKLIIVEQAVEDTAVSHEVAEQATTLLVVMPEKVQTGLKEYIQNAEPEAVEAVETQIVIIAKVADRLHELVMTEKGDSEEAAQIEEWLTENYSELLNTLGVEYDEETIEAFIELVRSDKYEIDPKTLLATKPYDPMHERKDWSDSPGNQTRTNLTDFLRAELARFAVHHGLSAASTGLAA